MEHIYIIEHLEPELYQWCLIEYKSISKIVGKQNLWFTNIKEKEKSRLKNLGKVFTKSVKSLNLKDACILDPEASKVLTLKDSKQFKYFIFGGILGDYPPRKRTKEELTPFLKGKTRNIGREQFSTDNAVYVVKQITSGIALKRMKFQNELEIKINKIESILLPYSYPLIKNKPKISNELVQFLKKKKIF